MNNNTLDTRLKDIFVDLSSINAISAAEGPVADYIENFVKKLNISAICYRDKANDLSMGNTGNLIIEICGGGDYLLASHMDTPRPTLGLKHVFLEDRITSDGTTPLGVDDRGGISAILYGLERAAKDNKLQACTILFTVCEETTLAGSIYYKPKDNIRYGFVFDSYMRVGNFVNRTCGSINFEFTIIGKSAHAGICPQNGISAIEVAAQAITHFPFGRIDDVTTANIGIINGGSMTNVVCDRVKLVGELRTDLHEVGETKINKIIDDFKIVANKYGAGFESKYFWDFLPYCIDIDDEPYVIFCRLAKELGLNACQAKSMGGSDANSLNAKGIKTINLGVGAQNPHGNDEFILYEDLQLASDIAYKLLTKQN